MKNIQSICASAAVAGLGLSLLTGCATVSSQSQPYLGVESYAPTDRQHVQIVSAEPSQPHARLGEVFVDITGQPSKEHIENAVRSKAAKLGADAAFIVSDRTHLFPVVYADYWGATVTPERQRDIVAVAIRYKEHASANVTNR